MLNKSREIFAEIKMHSHKVQ